jgi:L-lactate utilization protein LutB
LQDLRERAHRIKEETIGRLDYYLEQLESKVIANGTKVFGLETVKFEYVLQIARRSKPG